MYGGKWNSRKTGTGAGTENGNGNSYNSLQTIKLPCSVAAEVLCHRGLQKITQVFLSRVAEHLIKYAPVLKTVLKSCENFDASIFRHLLLLFHHLASVITIRRSQTLVRKLIDNVMAHEQLERTRGSGYTALVT